MSEASTAARILTAAALPAVPVPINSSATANVHGAGTSTEVEFGSTVAMLPVRDAASRLFLLTRLVASFDEGDRAVLSQLIGCGCTPELIDRLRGMTMVDALRFTAEHCGLVLGVDSAAIQRQLRHIERRRAERETYEYLIRAGTSPSLLGRLFSVATMEVRRLRKIIAPGVAVVGRPRLLDEDTSAAIVKQWEQICAHEPSERQRYVLLHRAFNGAHLVATLETVLETHRRQTAALARNLRPRSIADTHRRQPVREQREDGPSSPASAGSPNA